MEKIKNSVNFEEQNSLAETIVSYALVCRGPLKDFGAVKEYVKKWTSSQVVYQTTSVGHLKIIREGGQPNE